MGTDEEAMKRSRTLKRRYGRSASSALIKRYKVTRHPIDRQGYDKSGRYFGVGAPLFDVYDSETDEDFQVRASNAKTAREKVVAGGSDVARRRW